MATMYPSRPSFPDVDNQSRLEEDVFYALKGLLDEDWHVFQSYVNAWPQYRRDSELIFQKDRPTKWKSEFDFIAAKKGRPLVCVEVKQNHSGSISVEPNKIISKYDTGEKKEFGKIFCDKCEELVYDFRQIGIKTDVVPAFSVSAKHYTNTGLQEFIIDKVNPYCTDNELNISLKKLFDAASSKEISSPLDSENFNKIVKEFTAQSSQRHRWLYYKITTDGAAVEEDTKTLLSKWIDKDSGRFMFLGSGGTGKTALMTLWGQRMCADGKKVLYLCYNRNLEQRIAEEFGRFMTVRTHFGFFRELGSIVGGSVSRLIEEHDRKGTERARMRSISEFDLPTAVIDSYSLESLANAQYDAIFIDEAQDVSHTILTAFSMYLKPSGLLVVGGDLGQRDPRKDYSAYPPDDNSLAKMCDIEAHNVTRLEKVIRSSDEIATKSRSFRDSSDNSSNFIVDIIPEMVASKILDTLKTWCITDRVPIADVAVIVGSISDDKLKGEAPNNLRIRHGQKLTLHGALTVTLNCNVQRAIRNGDNWDIPLVTTNKSRGTEYKAVIFVGVRGGPGNEDWHRYVGASRAISLLAMYEVESAP